eukprot:540834-Prymnesium_polylepis.2
MATLTRPSTRWGCNSRGSTQQTACPANRLHWGRAPTMRSPTRSPPRGRSSTAFDATTRTAAARSCSRAPRSPVSSDTEQSCGEQV